MGTWEAQCDCTEQRGLKLIEATLKVCHKLHGERSSDFGCDTLLDC
jgi:hypothetical protein